MFLSTFTMRELEASMWPVSYFSWTLTSSGLDYLLKDIGLEFVPVT